MGAMRLWAFGTTGRKSTPTIDAHQWRVPAVLYVENRRAAAVSFEETEGNSEKKGNLSLAGQCREENLIAILCGITMLSCRVLLRTEQLHEAARAIRRKFRHYNILSLGHCLT